MGMLKWLANGALLLLMFTFLGCSGIGESRSFLNPQVDFSFYNRIAVIPFKSLASDQLAAEKMTEFFMLELLIAGEREVMEQGQFNNVVYQVTKLPHPFGRQEFSTAQFTQIAEFAKVQGFFMGTIHEYSMITVGGEQYPLIAMTVKFIDAPTGTLVWQNTLTAAGGPNLPVISIGETFTLNELSQKICRRIVKDFYKSVPVK